MDPLRRLADDSLRALTGPSPSAISSAPASPSATSSAIPSAIPSASESASATAPLASGDCSADVRAFCGPEADVLALLREVRADVSASRLEAAARGLGLCLARHADALSPRCVEALAADLLGQQPAAAPSPRLGAPDDDSSVEISVHYARHHRPDGHALRAGGGALSAAHLSAGDVGHSLLWVLALPFCLLGMVVAGKEVARLVRRRREERRIECKQQYLPVQ